MDFTYAEDAPRYCSAMFCGNNRGRMSTPYDTPLPSFFRPADLATRWKITPMTLRRWRKAGKLKTLHLGRAVRFSAAEVQRIENEATA